MIKLSDKKYQATLIKESALKWWAIMKRNGQDKGTENCPLCQEYYLLCGECPIGSVAEVYGCGGTPYREWDDHQESHEVYDGRIQCPECYDMAREEFLFLCELYRKWHRDFK